MFDALVSNRPYKDAWSVEDALEEIGNQAGRQFDPKLAGLFVELAPGFLRELGLPGGELVGGAQVEVPVVTS